MPPLAILVAQIGASDCEELGTGFLVQPVNAISSLVFTGFGGAALIAAWRVEGVERLVRTWFGWLLIATGLGSFLFHGPQWPLSGFLHDVTFLFTLWLIAMANIASSRRVGFAAGRLGFGLGAAGITITLLLVPSSTNALMLAATAVVIVGHVVARRRGGIDTRWYVTSLALLASAVGLNLLGRTGAPWCRPDALLQGHGAWHVLAAAALYVYFMATSGARLAAQEPATSP